MAKSKAGVGKCDVCGEDIVWKRADSGTLSYTCQHCDYRGYAPAHSDAARMVGVGFVPLPGKAAPIEGAPIAKPEAEPKPAPVKAKKPGLFSGVYP